MAKTSRGLTAVTEPEPCPFCKGTYRFMRRTRDRVLVLIHSGIQCDHFRMMEAAEYVDTLRVLGRELGI